jgi:hypothetical protein
MTHQPTLEHRISSAIGNGSASSGDLVELIETAQRAAEAAATDATTARDKATLDLGTDVGAASAAIAAAELRCARLQAALPRLRNKLTEVLEAEHRARWRADFERVEKRRDESADKFAKQCPELLAALVELMREAATVDADCQRVNSLAGSGEPHLRGVELTARRLDSFNTQPSISASIRLPDYEHSASMMWPPPQQHFAAAFAAATPVMRDPRFSDDWWRTAEIDAAERRQLAERRAREQEAASAQAREAYEKSLLENERERERRAHAARRRV